MDAVTFQALGKEQSLRMTFMAARRFEKATGVKLAKWEEHFTSEISVDDMFHLFVACLGGGKGVPEDVAGEILDDIGFQEGMDLAMKVMVGDEAKAGGEGGPAGNA